MNLWQANTRRLTPYEPGEQPAEKDVIKLNTNENPYPPAPGVMRALKDIGPDDLRRYPDPAASELVRDLAKAYGVEEEQVFVGVGSDDVLAMSFLAFFNSEKPILFPDITYSFYPVWAELFGIPYKTPALDENFAIRPADYLCENGGIIFPNPNAPTGLYLPLSGVEEIVRENQASVVIVDEAYIDFGKESALPLLKKYDNLLVVQTFSKSRSLAGLRVGYAFGSPDLIRALCDVKYSFNSYTLNCAAIRAAAAAVRDAAYYARTTEKITATRERLKAALSGLGFTFPDSAANFVFAKHSRVPAGELFSALRGRKILVRHFKGERINDYLRITVGTDEETDALIAALADILGEV